MNRSPRFARHAALALSWAWGCGDARDAVDAVDARPADVASEVQSSDATSLVDVAIDSGPAPDAAPDAVPDVALDAAPEVDSISADAVRDDALADDVSPEVDDVSPEVDDDVSPDVDDEIEVDDTVSDDVAVDDTVSDDVATDDATILDTAEVAEPPPRFSFFVTSLAALQDLAGDALGFGGDLRFGETGPGAGLRGADLICATIAERSLPGAGQKGWRAFLSAASGENGQAVHAIDRVGFGPWYDRLGRLVASSVTALPFERPQGADPAIRNDLPNEDGVPNHQPDPNLPPVDNHDILTGSDGSGRLYSPTATCNSWTAKTGTEGKPRVGHSWPRAAGGSAAKHWISALDEAGCAPGVNLLDGPAANGDVSVGAGGGYGGFYCFSLVP